MTEGPSRKSTDERKETLARLVASQITQGRRIETQSDFQAVMLQGKPVNHVLHLLLTALTLGVWAVVWIAMVLLGGEKRELIQVDEWGNSSISKL